MGLSPEEFNKKKRAYESKHQAISHDEFLKMKRGYKAPQPDKSPKETDDGMDWKASLRGSGQGYFPIGDEAVGVAQAAKKLFKGEIGSLDELWEEYKKQQKLEKKEVDKAWKESPKSYAAGYTPALAASIVGPGGILKGAHWLKRALAGGLLDSFFASDKHVDEPLQLGIDVGVGGAESAAIGGAFKGLGKLAKGVARKESPVRKSLGLLGKDHKKTLELAKDPEFMGSKDLSLRQAGEDLHKIPEMITEKMKGEGGFGDQAKDILKQHGKVDTTGLAAKFQEEANEIREKFGSSLDRSPDTKKIVEGLEQEAEYYRKKLRQQSSELYELKKGYDTSYQSDKGVGRRPAVDNQLDMKRSSIINEYLKKKSTPYEVQMETYNQPWSALRTEIQKKRASTPATGTTLLGRAQKENLTADEKLFFGKINKLMKKDLPKQARHIGVHEELKKAPEEVKKRIDGILKWGGSFGLGGGIIGANPIVLAVTAVGLGAGKALKYFIDKKGEKWAYDIINREVRENPRIVKFMEGMGNDITIGATKPLVRLIMNKMREEE